MTLITASRTAGLGLISTLYLAAGPAGADPVPGSPPPPLSALDSLRARGYALHREGIAPTRASADSVTALLQDPDPKVRRQAVLDLGRMASRIWRKGVVDVPRDPQFPPLVEGLVPTLIAAADDTDRLVGGSALFALADTKEPGARKALRSHLHDPDPDLRLTAACLLTEFGDDSGMEELGRALERLTGSDARPGPRYDIETEQLLASLTRITGVSLGPIPPQPMVLSSMKAAEDARKANRELLQAWARWWRENRGFRD